MIKYKSLKNGMRIVAEEIPYVRSVSAGVWINVGARMEEGYPRGLAHFIEHMLFKGTQRRSSKKISNDIDYYGGLLNAFTGHDHTCYHVKMPYNHILEGLDVIADLLTGSLFSEHDIEKEKLVIRDEIKMYEDSPEDYLYEELMKRTYSNRGVGRSVLGTIESIAEISRKDILDFFSKYYIPNNAVLVMSGNFVLEDIVDKLESIFSKWEPRDFYISRQGQDFKSQNYIEDRDDEQSNIGILFPCPNDDNYRDFLAVKLVNNILGNSTSSRLFQNIREDKGLTYNIYSSDSFYVDHAELGIYSSMADDNLYQVYKLIIDEIDSLKESYISQDELDFAKEQYKGSVLMNIEDTEDRMLLIGEYEVNDKRLLSIEEIMEIIDSIDLDYMKKTIDRIFGSEMSLGITGRSATSLISQIKELREVK